MQLPQQNLSVDWKRMFPIYLRQQVFQKNSKSFSLLYVQYGVIYPLTNVFFGQLVTVYT